MSDTLDAFGDEGSGTRTLASLAAPPETRGGAAVEVATMGVGGKAWRFTRKFGDDALSKGRRLLRGGDEAAGAGARAGTSLGSIAKGTGAVGAGGLATYSLVDPEGARQNAKNAADRASQGFGGALSGLLEGLLGGTAKAGSAAPVGFLLLLVLVVGFVLVATDLPGFEVST